LYFNTWSVAGEVIATSDKSSKAGVTLTVAQDVLVPLVVRYLPELPV
jgi:hypothetical protein